ncbi:hypothetical protein ACRRTK_006079 [Alexandromys fortis]
MNTFTGVNANVPNSRQVTTHGVRRENTRTGSQGLDFPNLLDRQDGSGNWFRNPCQPREILEVSSQLIPCTDHCTVLTHPPGWGFLIHSILSLSPAT